MSTTIDPNQTDSVPPETQMESTVSAASSEKKSPTPKRKPKKKTWYGKLGKSTLMLVRRTHLYSGIFMFPFVLLYGFTGWFFNHPRLFTGDEVRSFASADLPEGTIQSFPQADELAASVVEEMNLESFLIDGPTIELSEARTPRYTGYLNYSVNTKSASHQITVNPITGDGEVRTTHVVASDQSSDNEEAEPKINPIGDILHATVPGGPL
ncbi:hypothetical protein, partial [Rhodopirellula bahusiensis]